MSRHSHSAWLQARQTGQASVEYVVGLTAFILILIALPGNPVADLLATFKQFYSNFSYLLSTP